MLLLVVADRDDVGLIEQDVGGHQNGVGEQADVRRIGPVARRLVLELRHPARLAEAGDRREDPGELRVRAHVRLDVQGRLRRLDAGGDVLRGRPASLLAELRGVVRLSERVQVDDGEERLVGILQIPPLQERTDVVADLEGVGGRLHSGVEAGLGHPFSLLSGCRGPVTAGRGQNA